MEWPRDYEVIGKMVLEDHGSFKKIRYWVEGWHAELGKYGSAIFTKGWKGEDLTRLTIDAIFPIKAVNVKENPGEKPNF